MSLQNHAKAVSNKTNRNENQAKLMQKKTVQITSVVTLKIHITAYYQSHIKNPSQNSHT